MKHATPHHLPRAPIIEAIIAFRLAEPLTEVKEIISKYLDVLGGEFHKAGEIVQGEFKLGPSPSVESERTGAALKSTDNSFVIQMTKTVWSLSKLPKYSDWRSFSSKARELWSIYVNCSDQSHRIQQASLRYINKIYVPAGKELAESLDTYARIAPNLPQVMRNCVMRLELEIPNPPGVFTIMQAQLPTDKTPTGDYPEVPFVLDHSLAFEGPFHNEEDAWAILEKAHDLKNDYFFDTVAEHVIQEFE